MGIGQERGQGERGTGRGRLRGSEVTLAAVYSLVLREGVVLFSTCLFLTGCACSGLDCALGFDRSRPFVGAPEMRILAPQGIGQFHYIWR
jgi:hypothetical protein